MNESKHTPGPWEMRDFELLGETPHIVARRPENEGKRWKDPVICNFYDDVTPEDSVTIGQWYERHDNCQANARLIAAAPELLDALKACADALGDCEENDEPMGVTRRNALALINQLEKTK